MLKIITETLQMHNMYTHNLLNHSGIPKCYFAKYSTFKVNVYVAWFAA